LSGQFLQRSSFIGQNKGKLLLAAQQYSLSLRFPYPFVQSVILNLRRPKRDLVREFNFAINLETRVGWMAV